MMGGVGETARKGEEQTVRKLNAGFIALFMLTLGAALGWLALDDRQVSALENRSLTAFPVFSVSGLLSGENQDTLEKALGDHLPFSEEIRGAVRSAEAAVLEAEQRALYRMKPELADGYSQITEGYYAWHGDEHRIVEKPAERFSVPAGAERFAERINALSGVRRVLYWIDNSRSVNFDRPETSDAREKVRALYTCEESGVFRISGYEDYCRWFYQTDHHWNHLGSRRGYEEILALLKPGEEALPSGEEVSFPFVFNGSYARQTNRLCADEPFRIYHTSLPKMKVTLNGKRGTYGRMDAYLKGRYADEPLTNHYSSCYGGEYGEIVYDNGNEGRGNLLVIASSYSNPLNGLLASHFDRTVIIDPRYYAEWAGRAFDPAACVKEYGITDLLLLGDVRFFTEDLAEGDEG